MNYTKFLVGYGKSVDLRYERRRWTKDGQRRINEELDVCLRIVFLAMVLVHTFTHKQHHKFTTILQHATTLPTKIKHSC